MEVPHLPIVFQDEHLVVINKPHNLAVHRSPMVAEETVFALQTLRNQIHHKVFPCHRIDRKTAGLLVFALDKETEIAMQKQFQEGLVYKEYTTLVRGFVPESGLFDRPLENDRGVAQESETYFQLIETFEVPLSAGKYPHSRYSLVKVIPKTGRMHQIRRHFAQARHYLIGDKTHGDCKHNKLFETHFALDTMLLHASYLQFLHPVSHKSIALSCGLSDEFTSVLQKMKVILSNEVEK